MSFLGGSRAVSPALGLWWLILAGTWQITSAQLRTVEGGLYTLQEQFVGDDFFSKWHFYTGPDPTHGSVEFISEAEARQSKLISASWDRVFMGVDNTTWLPVGKGRKAIKILSNKVYNNGLFVLKVDNVPSACGAWPAFWMFGEDSHHAWPRWGEYDILESVHTLPYATTTLHTREGCDQAAVNTGLDFEGQGWAVGSLGTNPAKNCWVNAPNEYNNQGCGQKMPDGSFGPGLNKNGGGTFAAEWDPVRKHLRTWFWPNGLEPVDLASRNPRPQFWGMPNSFFTLDDRFCSENHFKNMRIVFDTTFCGDYANPSFAGACPQIHTSCDQYVRENPSAFTTAFWSIKGLDVYQRSGYADAVVNPPEGSQPQGSGPIWTTVWVVLMLAAVVAVGAASIFACRSFRRHRQGSADCTTKLHDACEDGGRPPRNSRQVSLSPRKNSSRELQEGLASPDRRFGTRPQAQVPASPERPGGITSLFSGLTGHMGFAAVPPNSPPPRAARPRPETEASTGPSAPSSETAASKAAPRATPQEAKDAQPYQPAYMPGLSFLAGVQSFAPLNYRNAQSHVGHAPQPSFNIVPEPSFAGVRPSPSYAGVGMMPTPSYQGPSPVPSGASSSSMTLPPTLPYAQGGNAWYR
eukprot:TRINITY_DN9359_c0_g2_i1.p1 TRINITY_DN9359_c0_g2~~TRINITY_DN9359_c0_g2_i1.p1  ORF type:complete len:635 (-),score=72.48 TRINITY_DN9359_c0_g2_i1:214-2118(-)